MVRDNAVLELQRAIAIVVHGVRDAEVVTRRVTQVPAAGMVLADCVLPRLDDVPLVFLVERLFLFQRHFPPLVVCIGPELLADVVRQRLELRALLVLLDDALFVVLHARGHELLARIFVPLGVADVGERAIMCNAIRIHHLDGVRGR